VRKPQILGTVPPRVPELPPIFLEDAQAGASLSQRRVASPYPARSITFARLRYPEMAKAWNHLASSGKRPPLAERAWAAHPWGVVGRDTELGELEQVLSDARQHRGRMVFLIGEEGIGKSSLITAVSDRALTMGLAVFSGRGSPIGPVAQFRPIAEAVSSLCRGGALPSGDVLGPYLDVLGHLVPDFAGAPPRGEPSAAAIGEAFLRLSAAAGGARGCLVVLEDVQDADSGTAAVLEYLADNLSEQPTVVIATMREERCESLDVARVTAQRGRASIMQLNRLGKGEVRELAAARMRTPAADVSDRTVSVLLRDSDGNPLVIVELLRELSSRGTLASGKDDYLLSGDLAVIPAAIVRSVSRRTARLGSHGQALFTAAAVFGRRFPATAVQAITGLGDEDLHAHLDSGAMSRFVIQSAPDWYTFSQPLAHRALLQQVTPATRALLANQAAQALSMLHPGLPGDWCEYAANLLLDAGDAGGAARLLVTAGVRALEAGTPGPAVVLLEQALELLAGTGDLSLHAEILDGLLPALTESGQMDRALQFEAVLDTLVTTGVDRLRLAVLHLRLGWAAAMGEQWSLGSRQLRAAHRMIGADAAHEHAASADALAAYLAVSELRQTGGSDWAGEHTRSRRCHEERAAELTRHATARAETSGQPTAGCQAWLTLAAFSGGRDTSFADSCYERAHAIATEYRLPLWRLRAAAGLAFSEWLAAADPVRLEQVQQEAHRIGATTVSGEIDARLALTHVLCGRYAEAETLIDHRAAEAARLQLAGTARHMALARAMLAAHHGFRRDMNRALADFRRLGGDQTDMLPLALGLVRVFCSLAEENTDQARDEIAQAVVSGPARYPLAGGHGLQLLLGVLSGTVGWPEHDEIADLPAARLRWNRQFTMFARAVLLGRDARGEHAAAVLAKAEQVASPFPLARYLGLRLVAEAAIAGRWGNPADWLRRAEEYFHLASVPAPASACRAILRRIGESVPQRRRGTDTVPQALRLLGVTLREYEVLQLLAERSGNNTIAERLHLSPRTVEKHVASLRIKSGQPDRAALCRYAAAL